MEVLQVSNPKERKLTVPKTTSQAKIHKHNTRRENLGLKKVRQQSSESNNRENIRTRKAIRIQRCDEGGDLHHQRERE